MNATRRFVKLWPAFLSIKCRSSSGALLKISPSLRLESVLVVSPQATRARSSSGAWQRLRMLPEHDRRTLGIDDPAERHAAPWRGV